MIPAQLQASKRWRSESSWGGSSGGGGGNGEEGMVFFRGRGQFTRRKGRRERERNDLEENARTQATVIATVFIIVAHSSALCTVASSALWLGQPLRCRATPPWTLQRCRGGARREISLRFHGADLMEKERPSGRKWPRHCSRVESGYDSQDVSRPKELRGERLSTGFRDENYRRACCRPLDASHLSRSRKKLWKTYAFSIPWTVIDICPLNRVKWYVRNVYTYTCLSWGCLALHECTNRWSWNECEQLQARFNFT